VIQGGRQESPGNRGALLAAFHEEIKNCTRCALSRGRTQVVFGSGNPDARIVFIGEAPGFHEDQQGIPFVGAAGKLLDQLLGSIGFTRQDVWVMNVLKCRPPGNRAPAPDEVETCKPYLQRQLEIIRPDIICTMGNHATQLITGRPTGITKIHGQPIRVENHHVFPIYHPAAALHKGDLLTPLKEDFQKLKQFLEKLRAAPPPAEPATRAEQMELL
jgi:uracil-DNA glycosylase family 4